MKWRYVLFDLETFQDEFLPGTKKKPHIVNYVVTMSFCSECDEESCTTCKQIHHFSGLHGRSVMRDFCVWALSDPVRNSTFISHNGKSFDTHFVLDYLIKEGNNPKLLMQGGKILSLKLRRPLNITFIDSLSFLNMPLASFTATFDLGDTVKSSFPHLLTIHIITNTKGRYLTSSSMILIRLSRNRELIFYNGMMNTNLTDLYSLKN